MRPSGDPFGGVYGSTLACGHRPRFAGGVWVPALRQRASLFNCEMCGTLTAKFRGVVLWVVVVGTPTPEAVAAVRDLDPVREVAK